MRSWTEKGLVAYYKFNGGSGQAGLDSTVNGNNGTLGSSPQSDANDPAWVRKNQIFPFVPLVSTLDLAFIMGTLERGDLDGPP
jgi:hypothetical protein